MSNVDPDVIIVGGGPVGLFLGCLLLQKGISCCILEQRDSPSTHTRSIGIHPPALECLAEVGVSDELILEGVPVAEGMAFSGSTYLGTLSFESCPPPFQFVLALPQFVTEGVLERRLSELDSSALVRGVTAEHSETPTGVVVTARENKREISFSAACVIGCDGKDSLVRSAAGIAFPGGEYTDKFLMGDFEDTSDLGPRAGIFLTRDGVVESFPLPGKKRRWVAKTDRLLDDASPDTLTAFVRARTGHDVPASTCTMVSAFSVYHYLAATMARGRILLAGDSAHVVSPIGGQGMNLGWLDATAAAGMLATAIQDPDSAEGLFDRYSRTRLRAARTARRRAEFNMRLGRGGRLQAFKHAGVKMALGSRASSYFAQRFTMHGL